MKKLISYAAFTMLVLSAAAATPDSKVLKSFNQEFPNAQDVRWNANGLECSVYFTQNGNSEKVIYDKKGNFVCSWKYSLRELPTNLMLGLMKRYANGNIQGITEYTTKDNVMYDVNVTKGNNLYNVRLLADGTVINEIKADLQ